MKVKTPPQQLVITVRSSAFADKGAIPSKYTCDGRNVNPPLDFAGIPAHAKSLVLIIDDPDAPAGTWLHWLVWNIPVTQHLEENLVPGEQGVNDFGRLNYGGPCPPSGTHRYYFRVFALDRWLDLEPGSARQQVEEAMNDHLVGYGELVGLYKRNR